MSKFGKIEEKLKEIEKLYRDIYDMQLKYFDADNENDLKNKCGDGFIFTLLYMSINDSFKRTFESFKIFMDKSVSFSQNKKEESNLE